MTLRFQHVRQLLPVASHGPARTWIVGHDVIKTLPAGRPADAQIPRCDGVLPWTHLEALSASQRRELHLPDSTPWILATRPFAPGQTLLEAAPCGLETLVELVLVLRDLHDVGIVHGDLHPANVIVGERLVVIDMSPFNLPQHHQVLGNPTTMAPELWEGGRSTPATDIYALACTLVFGLTGQSAFHASSLAQWATAHRETTPTVSPTLPGALAALLRRMLDKTPENRPGIAEILDVLTALNPARPRSSVWLPATYTRLRERVLDMSAGLENIVAADPECTRALFDDLALRLELRGERVVRVHVDPTQGPWQAFQAALAAEGTPLRLDGDLQAITERLWTELNQPGRAVLVSNLGKAGPDVRFWWHHAPPQIKAILLGDERTSTATELEGETADIWRAWRARTLRTDVAALPVARFDELVAQADGHPPVLAHLLNVELGIESADRLLNTGALRAIGPWRKHAEELLRQCAFGALGAFCESLLAPGRALPSDAHEVLGMWTVAAIRGSRDAESVGALLRAFERIEAPVQHAQLLHALGRHSEGLEVLAALPESPEVQLWRAQLSLSSGQLDRAKEAAARGETAGNEPLLVAQLAAMRLAPDAMRGDPAATEALRDLADRLARLGAIPSFVARAWSYVAIGLTRSGQLETSTDAYLKALEIIDAAGLHGELPTYLLNVGTAYHRQGRLGLAREHYARGIRASGDFTRPTTRALLLANLGNVDLALGRLDEAEWVIGQAEEVARQHGFEAALVMCAALRGDLLFSRGDFGGATAHYSTASERPGLQAAQLAELRLSGAEVALQAGELRRAEGLLDLARADIHGHQLQDFEPYLQILRARLGWLQDGEIGTMAGIETFRKALARAQAAGNHKLVLRQAPFLLQKLRSENLPAVAEEVLERVAESRNVIGTGLSRDMRREFFAHLTSLDAPTSDVPIASPPPGRPAPSIPVSSASHDTDAFYRLLSMNELILRAESLKKLMPEALEIALSLSGAERGFILLRDEAGALDVAASRDVDGNEIAAPHLAVSTTIAEEAARTGRTVLTLNARDDDRFVAARSIHTLDLTSVLCVPVRDGTGLLGAIYLDHRFTAAAFSGERPRLMEAFGHQLALAITTTRQRDVLRAQAERLATAQRDLEGLLRDKEVLVEQLESKVATLASEVELRRTSGVLERFPEIVARSKAMEFVLERVERVAASELPVVVFGESGTGKELIARAVHRASGRARKPFIAVNCGAISENLLESELFGHKKGAFTGADSDRIGIFQAADGGTVFLDEIGEMPPAMQVKLLRVLQDKRVRPVGSNLDRPVDVRIVAASHRDLRQMVARGDFREDLYFRVATVTLVLPPLRERPEDIPALAQKILEDEGGKRLTVPALRALMAHAWRGNIRELQNVLRAAALFADDEVIDAADLTFLDSPATASVEQPGAATAAAVRMPKSKPRGRKPKISPEALALALAEHGDDRQATADALGVSLRSLYRYLERT